MSEPRSLLLVGKVRPERKRSVTGMAIAAELPLVPIEESADALSWLESNDPGCVIVDGGISRLDKVIGRVRSKRELAHVPIFALVTTPDDLWIEQYYGWGGDDVVQMDAGATLLERLRAVPREVPKPVSDRRALVAEPDRARSEVFVRVLSLAGFDVRLAPEIRSLEISLKEFKPTVIIANSAIGELGKVISQARREQSKATWAILAGRRELESQLSAFGDVPGIFVAGVQSNPWQLLSRANEFCYADGPERRREPRRLFGSFVLFRAAGGDEDEVGVAYNLSSRGMFVRTYAPVLSDRVWLEWRIPQDKTRVRVEGKVVWRQTSLTDPARAASPLGFGVEFCDYLGDARKHLEQALEVIDSSSKRGLAGGIPSSIRRAPSSPVPTIGKSEPVQPVSLQPDAWELEVGGDQPRSAAADKAPISSSADPKAGPMLSPKSPAEKSAATLVAGGKPEFASAEANLKRPPPAPPPSVKAIGRQLPKPNAPPRPVAGPSSTSEALPATTAPVVGRPNAGGGSHAASVPRAALGSNADVNSLAGASTMIGLGGPPTAWLPTDLEAQASLARGVNESDTARATEAGASRGVPAEPRRVENDEEGPDSSDQTEILRNPTALFEIAADSIPPTHDAHDDTTTVVTSPILDSSVGADATPIALPSTPEVGMGSAESRFGVDELETRRWSASASPEPYSEPEPAAPHLEPEPAAPEPFYVSKRANSGASKGKLFAGGALLVLMGFAAMAYWASSRGVSRTEQASAPSVLTLSQTSAPSAVPIPAVTASANSERIVLPVTPDAKSASGEIPFAPLDDDGSPLDGYPPVEEFQAGRGRLLADRYGYLVVRFPEPAFIFANGIAMGTTNWKLATTCGEKTLRIGVGEKPVIWLSDDMRVNVVCRDTTQVVFRKLSGVTVPPGVQRPIPPGSGRPHKSAAAGEGEPKSAEQAAPSPEPARAEQLPKDNDTPVAPAPAAAPSSPQLERAAEPSRGIVDTRE